MAKKNVRSASKSNLSSPALPACWLFKSEADVFSYLDLVNAPRQTTHWDGVRNYEARNILRDRCRVGDHVLYYHSNADPSGIAGLAHIVSEAYADPSALDPGDVHFDPKSRAESPTWFVVDVQALRELPRFVSLAELRAEARLEQMALFRRSRLSVQPVTPEEYRVILELAGIDPRELV